MQLKVLSPIWGHEHLDQKVFLEKIRLAGYDGVDLWLPRDSHLKQALFTYLEKFQMVIVTHQYLAEGATFSKFKRSYLENLIRCAEAKPLLINSHTGRDYFSFDQNIKLFDIAANFSQKTSIRVAHETHRGRALFSPGATLSFLNVCDILQITADLSHWACVTESILENFEEILSLTLKK